MTKNNKFKYLLVSILGIALTGGLVWIGSLLIITIPQQQGLQINPQPTVNGHVLFGSILLISVIFCVGMWGWSLRRRVERKTSELAQSEKKNRQLLENTNQGIVIIVNMKIEYINPRFMSIFHFKSLPYNDFVHYLDFVHPEDHEFLRLTYQQLLGEPSEVPPFTFRIITADGINRWVKSYALKIDWANEPGLLFFLSDITEEHENDEMVKASEERYRLIFDQSPVGMFHYDTDLRITDVNHQLAEIMESDEESLKGFDLNAFENPEVIRVFQNVLTQQTGYFEGWIRPFRPNGQNELYVKLSTTPLITPKMEYQGGIGLIEDLTGQVLKENRIQNLEEKFSKVVITSTDAINITGLHDGVLLDVNSGFIELSGYSREEVIGKTVFEIGLWVNDCDRRSLIKQLAENGECKNFETVLRRKDGVERHTLISASLIEMDNTPCILAVTRDIDEIKKINDVVRNTELRYRSIFETVPVSIWQLDLSVVCGMLDKLREIGTEDLSVYIDQHPEFIVQVVRSIKVVDVNEVSLKFFKAESKQQLMSSLEKILPPDPNLSFRNELLAIWNRDFIYNGDKVNYTLDGEQKLVNLMMRIPTTKEECKNVLVSVTDVTQRKLTEAALRESEQRYRAIFNSVPVSIKEADYSIVIGMMEKLREAGITNFEYFLTSHPEWVRQAVKSVIITEVNQESLRLYKAETKEQLLKTLDFYFAEETYQGFAQQLVALWNHEEFFEYETVNRTVSGELIKVWVSLEFPNGKTDYTKILVTSMDITERKESEEQIHLQLRYLAALRAVDMAISASLDLPITLRILLNQIHQQLIADAAAVLILDPNTQTLKFSAGIGFQTNAIEATNLRLGQSYAGQVALERRIITSADLASNSSPFKNNELEGEEFTHYIGIPLISKGTVKGVLELFNRGSFSQDQSWMGLMESMAGQAAIAIENATLMDEIQRVNLTLRSAYDTAIEGWARSIDPACGDVEGHSKAVADLTIELAQAAGYQGEGLWDLRRGALLHDIGKLSIPTKILLKPGKLNEAEWSLLKTHPMASKNFLSSIDSLQSSMDIPCYHHEHWDGSGYPNGLAGEDIPYAARLFAVVECWISLRSDRPWRKAWTDENTWNYIEKNSGVLFDPQVVEKFRQLLGHGFTVYY